MGKTINITKEYFYNNLLHQHDIRHVNFLVDPLSIITYERLGLVENVDKYIIFHSLKTLELLNAFLKRLINYYTSNFDNLNQNDITYNVIIFVPTIWKNIKDAISHHETNLKLLNINVYIIQEDINATKTKEDNSNKNT